MARSHVRDALAGVPPAIGEVAQVLVSELVTNAVMHAGTDLELQIHITDERIRIAVQDTSPAWPEPQDPAEEDTSGRGLLLIHALSPSRGRHKIGGRQDRLGSSCRRDGSRRARLCLNAGNRYLCSRSLRRGAA
jgi:hypothetical protein